MIAEPKTVYQTYVPKSGGGCGGRAAGGLKQQATPPSRHYNSMFENLPSQLMIPFFSVASNQQWEGR